MNTNCLVCGSPTQSHHVVTTDGVEQYCCHSCWQRRNSTEVHEALAAYDVVTGEVLDDLLTGYRSATTAVNLKVDLPDLPTDNVVEYREGPGGEIFELAGAKQVGQRVEFDGRFAGVISEVNLPRPHEEKVCAAFGYERSGGDHTEAYLAWLCIGDSGAALADALGKMVTVLRGGSNV